MPSKRFDSFEAFQQAYHFNFTDTNSVLGSGNYGQVVKGWQSDENREVAIKCSFRPGDDSVRREFEGASGLNHPNIARYLAYGRLMVPIMGQRDFIVMQYYPDGNLSQFIRDKKNKITDSQRKSLVRGILEGLAYLHGQKRLHRDFKPSNILVTYNSVAQQYVPIITDFGSVKLVDKAHVDEFSLSDHAKTLAYAAPEQIRGDTQVSYNLDLWAFGVVLYEIMTEGSHPFMDGLTSLSDSTARTELSKRIMSVELPKAVDQIAEPYQSMLKRCLVADRNERIQTATAVLDLLDEVPKTLALAQTAFEQQDYKAALGFYEKALTLRPANKTAQQGLVECQQLMDQPMFGTDPIPQRNLPAPDQQVAEEQLANPETIQPPAVSIESPVVRKFTLSTLRSRLLGKKSEQNQNVYPPGVLLRVGFLGLGFPLALGYMIVHNFKVFGKAKAAKMAWLLAIIATIIELGVSLVMPFNVSEAILIQVLLLVVPIAVAYYVVKQFQTADLAIQSKAGRPRYSGWRVVIASWAGVVVYSITQYMILGAANTFQYKEETSSRYQFKFKYSEFGTFHNGLAPVYRFGKWGYINTTGELTILNQFHDAGPFSEGLARVNKGGKWGFINTTGQFVILPQFDEVGEFSDGLAPVQSDDGWGFIDKKGQQVIAPQFENAGVFKEGLAPFMANNYQWGYIDKKGRQLIAPQFNEVGGFSEGLAPAKSDTLWGYIDKKGQQVIVPQFKDAGEFKEGLASIEQVLGGYINKKGQKIIGCGADEYEIQTECFGEVKGFNEGLAPIQTIDPFIWGYINKTGEQVIAPQFGDAHEFSNGLATVKKYGRAYVINSKGRIVISNGFTIFDLFVVLFG